MNRKLRKRTKPAFIEPMQCKPVTSLPTDEEKWSFEIKFDGYRCVAVKSASEVTLCSRNEKVLYKRFPKVVETLASLEGDFVLDGALDRQGRPSFQLLQNNRSRALPVYFYAFDLLNRDGKSLVKFSIERCRELLASMLAAPKDPLRLSRLLEAPSEQVLDAVKKLGLEDVVRKRIDSIYEPGERSGVWIKLRTKREQEFVIGGYIPSAKGFDAFTQRIRDQISPDLKSSRREEASGPVESVQRTRNEAQSRPLTCTQRRLHMQATRLPADEHRPRPVDVNATHTPQERD